jgi:glycosyltransferase involved in cell wall biosynthesis
VGKIRICVVSFIVSKAFNTPLNNLKEILNHVTKDLYVLTANAEGFEYSSNNKKIKTDEIIFKKDDNKIIQLIRYLHLQMKISSKLIKSAKKTDCYIFFMEGVGILPMLFARLKRKKIIWMIPSSILLKTKKRKGRLTYLLFSFTQKISAILANRIIVYSPNLINEWELNDFKDKIRIAHEHFLNFEEYKINKKFEERKNLIGHIGRLSEEKGTMNFVKSIPGVLKNENKTHFLIGGDGELKKDVKEFLIHKQVNGKAKLVGWIPKNKLPEHLNKLKLIVLSSYTEGLPNIMLEAMACGTPVLATSVGGIPDFITDNETGFLLKDNSPAEIKKSIIRAINHTNLKKISENARKAVKNEFKLETAVKKFKDILNEVMVK